MKHKTHFMCPWHLTCYITYTFFSLPCVVSALLYKWWNATQWCKWKCHPTIRWCVRRIHLTKWFFFAEIAVEIQISLCRHHMSHILISSLFSRWTSSVRCFDAFMKVRYINLHFCVWSLLNASTSYPFL